MSAKSGAEVEFGTVKSVIVQDCESAADSGRYSLENRAGSCIRNQIAFNYNHSARCHSIGVS